MIISRIESYRIESLIGGGKDRIRSQHDKVINKCLIVLNEFGIGKINSA